MEQVKLTPKLTLNYIEENNVQESGLVAVCCHFSFYGEHCTGYLTIEALESDWADFAMTESCGDLHESFNDQLEENWEEIVKQVKAYHEQWKKEMAEYD